MMLFVNILTVKVLYKEYSFAGVGGGRIYVEFYISEQSVDKSDDQLYPRKKTN